MMNSVFLLLFTPFLLLADPIIIGISGGSASGKTTFAEKIQKAFEQKVVIVSQDSYFKNFPQLSLEEKMQLNWDCPDAIDASLLQEHLLSLKQGKSIEQPVRNFSTFSREPFTKTVQSAPIIVVDGILIFAIPEIRDLCEIKIYIEADDDIRLLRRLHRDVIHRGMNIKDLFLQYLQSVKPMHDLFVNPSKVHADLIIPKGGESEISFELVESIIKLAIERKE